ncbi:transcriptional adapter 1-like [Macrobrachium nipponense]|uniref:transcriptional adapter 1-like n=1 Tax=Macrobrachium nipponense TaxID=159736 RepID=UPI0030C8533C
MEWYEDRDKVTKEEFDKSARELLALDSVHFHNEFLLAILSKCQLFTLSTSSLSSSSSATSRIESHHRHDEQRIDSGTGNASARDHASLNLYTSQSSDRKKSKPKKKAKTSPLIHDGNFEPVNIHDIAITASVREPQAITDAGAGYLSRSLCLLDTGPLKGRLLLAAWDHGITQVGDNVATMLQEATQQCLKNIIMAVVSRRRGYRVREGRFMHSLGTTPPNPWLRNTGSLNDWMSERFVIIIQMIIEKFCFVYPCFEGFSSYYCISLLCLEVLVYYYNLLTHSEVCLQTPYSKQS